ncbi:probable carboxylesterase 2 [Andrographis paniculata]|uniref:probable carboxylesterase 2 n=1 Tax=Andrographis paniculata TaxID=175694 RepID=UPI0021E9506C|nr:probable carboxylesterase 2 [Andrographis paniculata]
MATTDLDFELLPYLRVYKSGTIQRLAGTDSDSVPPATDSHTGVLSKDLLAIIPGTEVYVRIYLPNLAAADGRKLPLLVYFHGGFFILHSPSSRLYHDYLNALAAESGAIVVSVHYRRPPEHPLPVGYQDSWDALRWVAAHRGGDGAEQILNNQADFRRVFLVGDCAGGNIVHNLAVTAGNTDAGLDMEIQGIVLVDPYFNGSDWVGSCTAGLEERVALERLWSVVCPSCPDKDDPWVNPVGEAGMGGLVGLGCSRALVCVAEKDVLKDWGWAYFQGLGRVGWMGMVEIHEAEGEGHCFHLHDLKAEKAKERMRRMVHFINWEM